MNKEHSDVEHEENEEQEEQVHQHVHVHHQQHHHHHEQDQEQDELDEEDDNDDEEEEDLEDMGNVVQMHHQHQHHPMAINSLSQLSQINSMNQMNQMSHQIGLNHSVGMVHQQTHMDLPHHTTLPFSFHEERKDELDHTDHHGNSSLGSFPPFRIGKKDSPPPMHMDISSTSPLMSGVFKLSHSSNSAQPAILYCKDINKFKKYWERWKKASGSSASSWQSDLGIEVLLPRSGFEDSTDSRMQNTNKKQKRKSLSELSQQYKPIRKIIGLIDDVCYRENGETFRDMLRKLPEEKKAQEEIWIKRRKMAIEMEVTKKIKSELKNQIDISEGLAEQVMGDVVVEPLSSTEPKPMKKQDDDISIIPENIEEEWGFTPEQAKEVYERQQKEIDAGKKIFCRWNKIGKELGNKHFKELPHIGERIHHLLRLHFPKLVPPKSREVSTNPKEEWGFDADDIKLLIEQHDADPNPKKEKLSMRKIGEILGNKHRLHPEKKPFAERNDRNQLVHSLLKKKYPELAKRFERKGPVTRHPKRKL